MTRDEVLSRLRAHRADIQRLGVASLRLFGSAARDEAQGQSDVDLLVEFAEPVGLFRFLDVQAYLESLLGCKVDLVTPDGLKPRVRSSVLEEAVDAL